MQTGADEDKIREVPGWRESPRFSEMERVALEYAEAMTITGQRVGDELFARLRALFDDAQIVELTAAVALENFRSKFNVPLQVESQGFCILHLPSTESAETRSWPSGCPDTVGPRGPEGEQVNKRPAGRRPRAPARRARVAPRGDPQRATRSRRRTSPRSNATWRAGSCTELKRRGSARYSLCRLPR
jgi:hypothetical protein